MDKYRELYILSKEVFNEELERSHRIDEKALKYLTTLTLLIGLLVLFENSRLGRPLLAASGPSATDV